MLVIVSGRDVAAKLDNSMFPVEGSYEDGYIYNRDVFFMEGIGYEDWCKVEAYSTLKGYQYNFKEVELDHAGIICYGPHQWDTKQMFITEGFSITVYSCGIDQLFVIFYGTEYLGEVSNDIIGDGYIMSLNEALEICLNAKSEPHLGDMDGDQELSSYLADMQDPINS